MEQKIRPLEGTDGWCVVQYRNRAEELRVIAEDMLVPSEKEALCRIARTYDDMASMLTSLYAIPDD